MSATPDGLIDSLADLSALADSLERLVLEFERLRRSAMRQTHVSGLEAYLLRLAAQPDGVLLSAFRQHVGLTHQRASQIARALETKRLVERRKDRTKSRARVVSATRKGRQALSRFDVLLAEALEAALADGEGSSLQVAITAFRLTAAPFAQATQGRTARPRKGGTKVGAGSARPTFFDHVPGWDSGESEVGEPPKD